MTRKIGFLLLIGGVCAFWGYKVLQAGPGEAQGLMNNATSTNVLTRVYADKAEDVAAVENSEAGEAEDVLSPEKQLEIEAQDLLAKMDAGIQLTPSEKEVLTRYLDSLPHDVSGRGSNPLDNVGGPDGGNYFYVDNVSPDTATYDWIELRGDPSATAINSWTSHDDGYSYVGASSPGARHPIGFSFPFYGAVQDSFRLGTNGFVQFTTTATSLTNAALPSTNVGGPAIFAYWDDLHLDRNGQTTNQVMYRNFGTYTVIEYDSIGVYNSSCGTGGPTNTLKFEVILFDDGKIKVQYNTVNVCDAQDSSMTVGIQSNGAAGSPALQYGFGTGGQTLVGHLPTSGLAIWYYQQYFEHDFATSAVLSPTGIYAPGSVVNVTARFMNVGTTTESSPVSYSFNGGPTVTEATGVLAQFGTEDHTFGTPITLPAVIGSYPLTIWTDLSTDAARGNDTMRVNVVVFAGGDCASAIELTGAGPDSTLYNNCGGGDNSPGQSCGASGQDMVFYMTVPAGNFASIWQTSNTIDSRHSLRWAGTCPGDSLIGCVDSPDERKFTWVNNTGLTQTLYFVVGGWSLSTPCGNIRVAWTNHPCTPLTPPVSENFDGSPAPTLPDCWTIANTNNATPVWESYATTPRSAPNSASILGSATGNDDWLFTPGISLTAGTAYTVEFYWRAASATAPESLEVRAGLANTSAGMTETVLPMDTLKTTAYVLRNPTFIAPSSDVYYFGWHNMTRRSAGRTRIDDVAIYPTSGCGAPTVTVNDSSRVGSVPMTAIATGGYGGALVYQWYTGQTCTPGNEIVGATSSTYLTTVSGDFACRVYRADSVNCAGCDWGTATVLPPPPGETCANAITLTPPTPGVPTAVNGTTTGFIADCTDSCDFNSSSEDVFYSLTLTECRRITMSLYDQPTSGDMHITVYESGQCCLNAIMCDDDKGNYDTLWWEDSSQRPAYSLASFVGGELSAGTYLIRVGRFSTGDGNYNLVVYDNGPCSCNITCEGGDQIETAENIYDLTFHVTDPDGGCNNTAPAYGAISAGQTVCGVGFNYLNTAGDYYRDTDWYQFTVAVADTHRWAVTSEFRALIGIIPDDCVNDTFMVSALAPACTTTTASLYLTPGTYSAFVSPQYFTGNPMPATYRATLTAGSACVPDTVSDLTVSRDAYPSDDVTLRWTSDLSFAGTYTVYYNNAYDATFPGTWTVLATGITPATSQYVDTGTVGANPKRFYLVVGVCDAAAAVANPAPDSKAGATR